MAHISQTCLRIGFVSDHAFMGGGEQYLFDIAHYVFNSEQLDARVAVRTQGPLTQRLEVNQIPCRLIPYPLRFRGCCYPVFSPRALRQFIAWIREENLSIIHANGPLGLFYAGLAARWVGAPVVFTAHLIEDMDSPWKRWMLRTLPTTVVAVSRDIESQAHAVLPNPKKVQYIPIGIEAESYAFSSDRRREARQRLGWTDQDFVCAHIGRIQPVKGQLRFLDAMARVVAAEPNIHGWMVGAAQPDDVAGQKYRKAIDAMRRANPLLTKRVLWNDGHRDAAEILSAVDCLVVSSDRESFGRVVLEAMACGRPVITTPCGGPSDLIHPGAGVTTVSHDPGELARQIIQVAKDWEACRAMGAWGRRRIAERYTLRITSGQLIQLYQSLLA